MMTKIRDVMARREAGEKGFTLVELLVVIIIIGILAAVAIPIFLNQQKSGIDSNTRADVRNVAVNIETLRTQNPTLSVWKISYDEDEKNNSDRKAIIYSGLGDTPHPDDPQIEVSLSKGTEIRVGAISGGSSWTTGFAIKGWNENGNFDTYPTNTVEFHSMRGGVLN